MSCKGTIPSQMPPWARPAFAVDSQIVTGSDTVDLMVDVTYINQIAGGPFTLVMPPGTIKRQAHRIFVVGSTIPNTATFKLTGSFVNAASLIFNTVATSAILMWDGIGWRLTGGNAQISSTP